MFDNYHAPFKIKGTNERQIESSIKLCLKELTERFVGNAKNSADLEEDSPLKPKRRGSSYLNSPLIQIQKRLEAAIELGNFKNYLTINGDRISLILKDESLLVLFLTLTSFCSLIILHEVNPIQRAMLAKHLSDYNRKGGKGVVLGVITTSHDRFMIREVDVSLALQKRPKNSDL